ncbi:aminodeoxychorismate synthase component I [Massilibacteroides sp.]|uniref:aminodeoxychorismate synthase component I n=1 Tax=Massilibacteroides sp. TaxID=2034766 RepID=UPI002636C11A|nr:aminodeoxychorismate synthase component I [Massilibacteroides sp.]MDD4516329.1 aminodeoxychorismate synthase component I [Massilibacteroides sp.]
MAIYSQQEAITQMNNKGRAGKPFLFLINYAADVIHLYEPHEIDNRKLLYDLNGITNFSGFYQANEQKLSWETKPVSFAVYERAFHSVADEIKAGNSYLTNLTFPTLVRTNISSEDIFKQAKAPYKLWLKDHFVCFSPEIFVRIKENKIYSFPMKGTIDATLPYAENIILADYKEEAEHATIVDLIRNDLSRVASEVRVKRYRYLDKITTNKGELLQVSSEIEGRLTTDWPSRIGDILFGLLPAGSISGAPKKKTLEIIANAEIDDRGFYTGIVGYFNGKSLDSAVMIRFIEQQGKVLLFRSGGGITSRSMAEKEYKELIQKVYVPIY